MTDLGLRVSSRLLNGPLWRVSARAQRLWLYVAAKADHPPQNILLSDGQRVRVLRGQWITSARKLRKELGGGSMRGIVADLAALKAAGAVRTQQIPRYRKGNGGVTKTVTGGSVQNGNADCVMATLVTVEGTQVTLHPVTAMVTKEVQAATPRLSTQARRELENAERILAAEGR